MQLGFVSAILPDLTRDEVLAFAQAERFSCVELMCWPVGKAERKFAGVTHIDVTKTSEADARAIREQWDEAGVAISGLGFYPNILSHDREYAQHSIDHLKRVMDVAVMLGVRNVNSFIGAEHTKSVDANFDRFAKVWPDIVQHAEDRDLLLGIENCPMFFTMDEWPTGKNLAYCPAHWRRMFEIIPSPHFGLNFDPSHLIWLQIDVAGAILGFADRIHHAHAKDARIDPRGLQDVGILAPPLQIHRPVLPGLGGVNWGAFISALGEIGYDGPVAIEVEDDAYSGDVENRRRALRISRDLLAPYFG